MCAPTEQDRSVASNVRAVVEYDGTDFAGFQVQPGRATVQGEIERVLCQISQSSIRVAAGGRTDAGVHALGQVISFRISWPRSWAGLQTAMNALLRSTIAVQELEPTPEAFHARFSARSRHYRYTVLNRPVRAPLLERYCLRVAQALELDRMAAAASQLIGERDLGALGDPPYGRNRVRTVYRAEWRMAGDCLTFDIVANAFLKGMVRRAVGAMLRVGTGAMSLERFAEALHAGDKRAMGAPAAARGLCLIAVNY